jgi:hypothetical protein
LRGSERGCCLRRVVDTGLLLPLPLLLLLAVLLLLVPLPEHIPHAMLHHVIVELWLRPALLHTLIKRRPIVCMP